MSKHTPGPWVVSTGGRKHENLNIRAATGGAWIANSIVGGGTSEDGFANARLIAAAPELLEALKRVMGLHEAEADQTFCLDEKCGGCDECFARAAIAKAEGER